MVEVLTATRRGRGRGVFKKKQPPIDEAWAKGRNESPLDGRGRWVGTNHPSTGVGVVFLKKSTAHLRGVGEGLKRPAPQRGRGCVVLKNTNWNFGSQTTTTTKNNCVSIVFERNTIIFCRCCCLGTEIPIDIFFKTTHPRPRLGVVRSYPSPTPRRWAVDFF